MRLPQRWKHLRGRKLMTKKIVIIGAGGLGREVQWLIERINEREETWELIGYLDDGVSSGTLINGKIVLGTTEWLKMNTDVSVVCAIGCASVRKTVIEKIARWGKFDFPNLIDPDVQEIY